MIGKNTFSEENIRIVCKKYKTSYDLTLRAIYALGLVEALRKTGLEFVFKGGSSMMLLFPTPKRLSTDVDILVQPHCDIDYYIKQAAKIFPFVSYDESVRKTSKNISKKHFRFHYQSPNSKKTFAVLLDVLFADNNYTKTIKKPIKNDFILDDDENPLCVTIPSPESLLGDKLTAFAPHTIGINFFNENFTNDKRLEVVKQFYDISSLFDICHDFKEIKETYIKVAKDEISYRENKYTIDECLMDTFNAALSILSVGKLMAEDHQYYVDGFKKISEHTVGFKLNQNNAYLPAAKVMLLAVCILKDVDLFKLTIGKKELLRFPPYNKINRLIKVQPGAYDMAITAIEILLKD